MKLSYLLFFLLFFFNCNLFAQKEANPEKTFDGYVKYTTKKFGITCHMPKGFKDLNKYPEFFKIRKNKYTAYIYGPVLEAKDEECIIMYPFLLMPNTEEDIVTFHITDEINRTLKNPKAGIVDEKLTHEEIVKRMKVSNAACPRNQIISELKAATDGYDDTPGKHSKDSIAIDFDKYVTIVSRKKAREMFNADSVYFYEIPLEEPYQKKYTYCTGMVLYKHERATMVFKCFFTTDGKTKEQEYINRLSKQVWYKQDD
jgi:hypothetical protein